MRDTKMDRKLQELNQHIEALQDSALSKGEEPSFSTDPPFEAWIMEEPLFSRFKML